MELNVGDTVVIKNNKSKFSYSKKIIAILMINKLKNNPVGIRNEDY